MTIIALTCFLVAGAAATSILGRDSVPAARAEMTSPIVKSPVANRESKQDRLAVATLALASFEPPQTGKPERAAAAGLCIQLRLPTSRRRRSQRRWLRRRRRPRKPKAAAKPAPQKSYALLSDVQIAGIKERLKLSSDQESLLAGGGERAARGGPQDPRNAPGRSERDRRADRSRRRGSPAAEIGGDAAVVPVARGSEAAKCARSPASSGWKRWRR